MNHENLLPAFLLTLLAGLSTGLGSTLAFFVKGKKTVLLSLGLGFSAGVMIYVSFMEILPQAEKHLSATAFGPELAGWAALAGFLAGILATALVDFLVPGDVNPHDARSPSAIMSLKACSAPAPSAAHLERMGLFTGAAIALHNIPEGMATFTAALEDLSLGLTIAVAVAVHNIPEGISVSLPIYYATGNRKKAFIYSFLSGLAEPAGAVAGYLVLSAFLTPAVFGLLFSGVAGVMVYISFDEMLPTAREYGTGHVVIAGLTLGMAVMGISLLLL